MHDVHRSFGAHQVLRGVDLTIASGEICALVGENGAGKSTLLDIAVGALPPTRGAITLAGHSIDDARGRRDIGYAPAHAPLPEQLAVHEWLDLLAALRDVSAAQVDAASDRWGLGSLLDSRLSALSLGQRRRLALAVATMGTPTFLVLDEPTVGLDEAGIALLVATLAAHRDDGGAALVASHEPSFVTTISTTRRQLVAGRIVVSP
ncbi:MAG: ABC transporter ATP-binding protein [Polyangiales bacterium]